MTASSVSAPLAELLAGTATVCREWAEQDLGPYYLEQAPKRRDVSEDRAGVALGLGLALADNGGAPLDEASVEIWHCDAHGRYSGFPPPEPTSNGGSPEYLADRTFLRGTQDTDRLGRVEFRTIYPGWYPGRTVHIHVIARAFGRLFTSQLYFEDKLSDSVLSCPPYSDRPGRDTTNTTDVILPTGGDPAVLQIVAVGDGYLGAARLHLPIGAE